MATTFADDDEPTPARTWSAWVASAIVHALLLAAIWWTAQETPPVTPPQVLRTEMISPQELARRVQVAPRASAPQADIVETESVATKARDAKARFRSDRTNRVEQETVAPGFGSAHGADPLSVFRPSPPKPTTPSESKADDVRLKKLGLGDALLAPPVPPAAKPEPASGQTRLGRGSMDALPKDIAVGARTLLNTDEYVYASFFNRVKAELGPRWEPFIRRILYEQGKRIRQGTYFTNADLYLSPAGQIERVEIVESSGVGAFDEAARQASLRLPLIPNLPAPLKEGGGNYRMRLGFIVQVDGTAMKFEYAPDPRLRDVPGSLF